MRFLSVLAVSRAVALASVVGASRADAQTAPVEWRLRRESAISGDGDGPAALTYIMKASRGPGGTLVVSQPSVKYLVAYDSAGKFIGAFGRSGRGPGEFEDVTMWGWRQDSIWVYDFRLRRLTVLARDGRYVRDTSRVLAAGGDEGFVALLNNGAALIGQHNYSALAKTAPAGTEVPASFRIEKRDGTRGLDIGPFRTVTTGTRIERTSGPSSASTSLPWLWHDNPLFGVSPNGAHIVIVEGQHPLTQAGSFRVHRYASTGQRVSSTTHAFVAKRVTQAMQDSLDRVVLPLVKRVAWVTDDMLKKAIERTPKPPQWLRAFDRVVVQNDGTLWLRSAANSERWFAVQANNQIVAEIRLPARAMVLDGDGQSVWVSVLDDVDVPSIVRYRIERR